MMRAILVVGALVLASISFLPTASAAPGYECAENSLTGNAADDQVAIDLRRDCSLEIGLFDGIMCVGGWGDTIERDVQQHTIRASYCTGRDLGDLVAPTSAAAPGCSPKTHSFNDKAQGTTHTIETHHNCSADITLNEGVTCVGAWTATTTYEVGPVTITNHHCRMSTDPGSLAAAGPSTPCSGATDHLGIATIYYHASCNTQVDVKLYDCVWNCAYRTIVDTALLTVRVYQEDPNDQQMSAAAPDCSKAATVQSFGAGSLTVTTSCEAIIELEPYQCLWGGHWVETTAGPVTLRRYHCDPYPDPYPAFALPDVPVDPCPIMNSHPELAPLLRIEMDKNPCLHTHVAIGEAVCQTGTTTIDRVSITACSLQTPAPQAPAAQPQPTCGIVAHTYEVGPATVTSSMPCLGVRVDAFGDDCQDDVSRRAYGIAVAIDTC